MAKRFGPIVRRTRKPPDPAWEAFMSTEEKESQRQLEWLETSLADTGLTVRAVNCLENHNILTVADLAAQNNEDLLCIKNFGVQTLQQCKQLLVNLEILHKLDYLKK